MKIEWHPFAEQDLIEIIRYVAAENAGAANYLYTEIDSQITILKDYPYAGRIGRVNGTRELVIVRTSYIVAYRVLDEIITILRILHGARKWPELQKK